MEKLWKLALEKEERLSKISRMKIHCPDCGTNQIQTVVWSTDNIGLRCRRCKKKFSVNLSGWC